MQADIEHVQYLMEQKNYRFNITELGGQTPKFDRIMKLVPIYEQGRFYMPRRLVFSDYEGRTCDFVKSFLEEEFLSYPVCGHDDMLDCQARILDPVLGAEFPKELKPKAPNYRYRESSGWMG